MNPPIDSPVNSIVQLFQAIVEVLPNGQFTTWVTEFQDSKVIAADSSACAKGDRATAIIELEKVLKKRLESIECVMIEVDTALSRNIRYNNTVQNKSYHETIFC
jgi:hypothetical protein